MLYTLKQFIKHGVHLGHYKWECDYRLSYFLLGMRNSIHIINLFYTLFILKQALYIAYSICITNQKLLVANNVGYKLVSIFEKINNVNKKYLWYINNKWIGGLLSNQRGIFLNNEKLFLEFYGVGYSSLLPSYVFASNIKETTSCIFEAVILDIPCSALVDSNIGFYGIFYGLPSNDDNFLSVYMFTKLFIKIYLKSVYDKLNSLKIENMNFTKTWKHNKLRKSFSKVRGTFWKIHKIYKLLKFPPRLPKLPKKTINNFWEYNIRLEEYKYKFVYNTLYMDLRTRKQKQKQKKRKRKNKKLVEDFDYDDFEFWLENEKLKKNKDRSKV